MLSPNSPVIPEKSRHLENMEISAVNSDPLNLQQAQQKDIDIKITKENIKQNTEVEEPYGKHLAVINDLLMYQDKEQSKWVVLSELRNEFLYMVHDMPTGDTGKENTLKKLKVA